MRREQIFDQLFHVEFRSRREIEYNFKRLRNEVQLVNTYLLSPTARLTWRFLKAPMPRIRTGVFLAALGISAYAGAYCESKLNRVEIPTNPIKELPTALTPVSKPDIIVPVTKPKITPTEIDTQIENENIKKRFSEPFDNEITNQIAKAEGIDAGTFYVIPNNLMSHLNAFLGDKLYPIYPPAVLQDNYKALIYELAKKNDIPPNIIAAIISIESAGIPYAKSSESAQGLMQVMPIHFKNKGITNPQDMLDPRTNIQTGIDVFKYFLNESRKKYGDPKKDNKDPANNTPIIYVRALMGYNGGFDALENEVPIDKAKQKGKDVALTPEESAFYGDHMIRFIVTAQIAEKLRQSGKNEQEIIHLLASDEIRARGYALGEFHKRRFPYTYAYYDRVIHDLARPIPFVEEGSSLSKEDRIFLQSDYLSYFKQASQAQALPTSAGLNIWLYLGGSGLFKGDDKYNTNPEAWKHVNSLP